MNCTAKTGYIVGAEVAEDVDTRLLVMTVNGKGIRLRVERDSHPPAAWRKA